MLRDRETGMHDRRSRHTHVDRYTGMLTVVISELQDYRLFLLHSLHSRMYVPFIHGEILCLVSLLSAKYWNPGLSKWK